MSRRLSHAQKAATLLMSVGKENAAKVLEHLSDEEGEQLALEIAALGDIPAESVDAVLKEFNEELIARRHLVSGGEDYARELLRRWRGADADQAIDRLLATVQTAPFSFLRRYDPAQLANLLSQQHPQIIALVLAHLPANFAAKVMKTLDAAIQLDVSWRIALMGQVSLDVVKQVEAELQARFGGTASQGDTRQSGSGEEALAKILNDTGRGIETAVLGDLEEGDPDLAEQVRSYMFVFEDIAKIDDRSLQRVLQEIDQQTIAKALRLTRDEVSNKIRLNVSERKREEIDDEMEVMGPLRRSEAEAAQSEIVNLIREMEEREEITISRGEDDALV